MKPELDNELCTKYPLLYADRGSLPASTLMCYGFACGDGWFDLIDDLSSKLETLIAAMPENVRSKYKAVQVKEKFGTLRFYMTHSTNEMEEIINVAEDRSATTCDVCGLHGSLSSDRSWIRTLCEKHVKSDSINA
jgi:hypothetical protein